MKTVIMAGGKGTRIAEIASDIPKPMIPIAGKPVLEREIECLKSQGLTDIIITVSHLGNVIMDYFGDGSKFGVNISYYFEKEPLGNAGALFRLRDTLKESSKFFLLLNADSIFDINFKRFIDAHVRKNALVSLFTHPNSHPYDSGLIIANEDKQVDKWLAKEDDRPEFYENRVNAGLHIMAVSVLDGFCEGIPEGKVDLDRDLLKPLAGTGKMYCYDSPEYVRDMGTPERYRQVCADYESGIITAKNLRNKQKAIFLDRDGTINRYVGFLRDKSEFELLDGASEAIKKINDSEYLAIVITNQPVVARGEVTVPELHEIHNKMETLLGRDGAYLDDLYYCPHHPDSGFEGEVKELKIQCDCRKPKPGMIIKAASDYNIDLENSWMIGDSKSDVECGKNAGTHTAFIQKETTDETSAELTVKSLIEAVDIILERKM